MVIDAQDHLQSSNSPPPVASQLPDSVIRPVSTMSNSNDEFAKLALNIYKTLSSTKRAESPSSEITNTATSTPFAGFPFSFYQKQAKSSPPLSASMTFNQNGRTPFPMTKYLPNDLNFCYLQKKWDRATTIPVSLANA